MTLLDWLLFGWALLATIMALLLRRAYKHTGAAFDEAMALLETANAGWGAANSSLFDLAAAMRDGEATLSAARAILAAAEQGQPLPLWNPPHDERLN